MRTNLEILSDAWQSLKGQRALAFGVLFVYLIVTGILSFIDGAATFGLFSLMFSDLGSVDLNGGIFQVLYSGAFAIGYHTFTLNLVRRTNPDFENLFTGFNRWGKVTWASIVYTVRLVLWFLLLIIPGIVKSLAYSQIWFILVDHPELSANQAIKQSEEMMKGYKTKYFLMFLWFSLLSLAGILTLFIGFIWIGPWIAATTTQFYLEVKADWDRRNTPDEPLEPSDVVTEIE